MQSISVFLDIAKVADFLGQNADVCRAEWVCRVIYIKLMKNTVANNTSKHVTAAIDTNFKFQWSEDLEGSL